MSAFFTEIRQTLVPDPAGRHGPLPPLLVALTLVTGLVDAFSYLALGHVFVANMTGNVVFLAFALAGTPGFSIAASVVALGSFSVGALAGGALGSRVHRHRARLLSAAATLQSVFLAVAFLLALPAGSTVPSGYRYGLIVVLAVAMGIQNAAARTLAVPDLTTTVLTLTLTGISADSGLVHGSGSKAGRRSVSVAAMFLGALVGALLVVHGHNAYPLAIALVVAAVVAVTTRRLGASDPAWATGDG